MKNNKRQFYVICHNIRSVFNVGSIFRTADALAVDKIFLCGYTPTPKDEKLRKTSLGAEELVAWEKCAQTWRVVENLKKQGVFVVALELSPKSIPYNKLNLSENKSISLVLGNEVEGLPKNILDRCDAAIEIPMRGKKESLNVAVAFGVAGYEIKK